MIINTSRKFIFVGLPYSASSAISRELIEQYDGKFILSKHANITDLLDYNKTSRIIEKIEEYTIFAVFRDPIDMVTTMYTKLKTNPYGAYTNPQLYIENGGWVTKRARHMHALITQNKLSFNDFVRHRYKVPFDFPYSLNKSYITHTLDFSNIAQSFNEILQVLGLTPSRQLPIFNKTQQKGEHALEKNLAEKVFGPYYKQNTPNTTYEPPLTSTILYNLIQPVRFQRWKRKDLISRGKEHITDFKTLK